MLEGDLECELEDEGEQQAEAHYRERTGSLNVVACGDGEETNEADFRKVDTSHKLAESLLVRVALGVEICLVHIQEVVPERNVDKSESNRGETEDKRCNAGIRNSNNP